MAQERRVIAFKSEIDYICRCIMDRPDIETGGELFGYWTEDGTPVVMYAIGPGPGANHQRTFFNQDVDYLVEIGRLLKERFGLHHIGEWHSHHRLGLARPSAHDAHTMNSTIREKGLGRFLLCIGNHDGQNATVGAFFCNGTGCSQIRWTSIRQNSPVRMLADRELASVLVHPGSRRADFGLSSAPSRPVYAPGYWLSEKGNGVVLNDILTYLKGRNRGADVRPQLNNRGEVQVRIEYGRHTEDILFPLGFPAKAPVVVHYKDGALEDAVTLAEWDPIEGDILHSFIIYYENN